MKLFISSILVLLLSSYLYMPTYNSGIDVYVEVVESIKKENLKICEDKIYFYFNDEFNI